VQQKSVKDQMLRVFIRHVDYDHLRLEEGVRLFVAERVVPGIGEDGGAAAKQIQGFVLVDPLWRDGEVYGYVTSLNRMRRDGHHGGSYVELECGPLSLVSPVGPSLSCLPPVGLFHGSVPQPWCNLRVAVCRAPKDLGPGQASAACSAPHTDLATLQGSSAAGRHGPSGWSLPICSPMPRGISDPVGPPPRPSRHPQAAV
jgi:hypothetical protein